MAQWFQWMTSGRSRARESVASSSTQNRGETVEAKAIAAGSFVAIEDCGPARWAPRTYQAFAREGVRQNAVVYRCVRLIAEAAASIPLSVQIDGRVDDDHPMARLLAAPCPGATGTDLFEAWYGYLMVSGNAYLRAVPVGGDIRGLHVLRPDRVRIDTEADGWSGGIIYTVDGTSTRIAAEAVPDVASVLHLKLFHPDDDHYGLSPIEAASVAIDIHNGASRWNKALLDNAARPSGALVYSADAHMTAEQFARLKGELEESFQGARNAGRPLLLEGGLDWKSMSLSPRDMDFMAAKNGAARDIALALGVPPMLLGIPGDNTYANYQEANRSFWRQTVLPLVNRTARALTTWLAPAVPETIAIRPDLDAVEALRPERDALWQRLETVSFLTEDEKRAAVGLPPKAEAAADAETEDPSGSADASDRSEGPGSPDAEDAAAQ